MNKSPGYYKDERGREYYWDGRTRSYITDNSFSQFMTDMNTMTLWIVGVLVLIPVALGLIALVIWALVASPLVLLAILAIGFGVYVLVTHYMNQEAKEKRVEAQQRAEVYRRREVERRKETESRRKDAEARAEAKRRRIRETEAAISGYLAEGIRQGFVGKTHDDFLPHEDHPFDKVYAGMTEEERFRHANYVSANTTLKGL